MPPEDPRPGAATLSVSGADLAGFLAAVLERGVPFRFVARGSSMHPFIKDSDVITVSPLHGRAPRLGDVVAFRGRAEQLVVHRVVDVRAGLYALRGDNRPANDARLPLEGVLGVVTRVERAGRQVRLGNGPERALVAVVSRWGALRPLVRLARLPRRAARSFAHKA